MRLYRVTLLLCLGLFCLVPAGRAVPTADGLYARFTTSMGTFYCQLRYNLVPRTVGTFVSLTEGDKDWLDHSQARIVRRPFYDGLTFHRVIANGIIQSGSPNGTGSDDAGYRFKDEFNPALTHSQPGVLAMANSGTNSNGSQFYITVSPQPPLDNHYTIFGRVVEGMDIVTNISNVPANSSQKPLTPIILTNVTILRIGAAATAFDATAVSPPLPVPHPIDSNIQITGPNLLLHWQNTVSNEYRICFTANLANWGGFYMGPASYSGRYINDFRSVYRYQFFKVFETPMD